MTDENPETMAELYESEGYDLDDLTHPRDVTPGDIGDDTVVVAYTVVRNPDPDAPATTYALDEYDAGDVVATEDVSDFTDGAVSYPDDTPVTHGVVWAYRAGGVPKFVSIGYGNDMYGPDSDFEDPRRWDRPVDHVHGLSDDFYYFKL